MTNLYDDDFYRWLQQQAQLLCERRFSELDLDNLVEEIQSLARAEVRTIEDAICSIIKYRLLKALMPEARQRWCWDSRISEHQSTLLTWIESSPSLKPRLLEMCKEEREYAERQAADELQRLGYAGDEMLKQITVSARDVFGGWYIDGLEVLNEE
ncbi:DUF29 domain-containing protein [Noviherbaspirillum sp.]|uniref:DUF29 domain-containing protein n=1 Tax=Noviherbaspirillum sp. TaxID=1926288 RepID=UPI002FE26CFC